MDGAASAVEGMTGAIEIEAQERTAAERKARDRLGRRNLCGAGEPDDVVGGEGNDLVVAAPPTRVALV